MAELYFVPKKEVSSMMDMKRWDESDAYHEYIGFVLFMNEAVRGKKISEVPYITSSIVRKLLNMLEKIDKFIEIPPVQQAQEDDAFRKFCRKLKDESDSILELVLPLELHPAIVELSVYLVESVGNSTRIDYGTAHEMYFGMFLCCLFKIGALKKSDAVEVTLRVFDKYLTLVRKLQVTYNLKPSSGEDLFTLNGYQMLPFIWGSSQLRGNIDVVPGQILDREMDESFTFDYMFLSSIKYIKEVNTGPFDEHSKMLWTLVGSEGLSWEQINVSMKMRFNLEVVKNLAVIQHVLFGSILSIKKHVDNESVFNLTL